MPIKVPEDAKNSYVDTVTEAMESMYHHWLNTYSDNVIETTTRAVMSEAYAHWCRATWQCSNELYVKGKISLEEVMALRRLNEHYAKLIEEEARRC
jgi:hypothetical protein